jgi:hypothetical protein
MRFPDRALPSGNKTRDAGHCNSMQRQRQQNILASDLDQLNEPEQQIPTHISGYQGSLREIA